MTTYAVSSASQLTSTLNLAKAGDTITLAAGNYGDVSISKNFASDVTITSLSDSSPAVFRSLSLNSSSHLKLDGLSVNYTPNASSDTYSEAVSINNSHDISFIHSTVIGGAAVTGVSQSASALDASRNVLGLATGRGIGVSASTNVTVDDVEVSKFYKGIVLASSDNVRVSHSDVHDTRTTGIVAAGGNHITIDANHIHDITPWHFGGSGDHADYLAMWTNEGQASASTDIKITNNLMEQGKGFAVLGMWLQGDAAGYTNVSITGNAILGGHFEGLSLWDVHGGTVANNTLLQTSGASDDAPIILVSTGTEKVSVHDNKTAGVTDESGSTGSLANSVGANTIVTKWTPSAPGYYTSDLIAKTEADYAAIIHGDTTTPPVVTPPVVTPPVVTPPTTGVTLNGDWDSKTLTGGSGNDTLNSKNGSDTLSGGSGDDTYSLVAGRTQVIEAAAGGTDTVIAKGEYTLAANVENLTINQATTDNWSGAGNGLNNVILGNAGNNALDGAAGNDTLNGGAGNDNLSGGAGNDQLTGGVGLDTFKFAQGGGLDVITDLSRADKDLIDVSAFLKAGLKATLTDVGADVKIAFSTGDAITVTGLHASDLVATSTGYATTATGTTPPVVTPPVVTPPVVTPPVVTPPTTTPGVVLNGDWDSRTLSGGAGNDTLNSKDGSDTLSGGAGDDTYSFVAGRTQVVEAAGGGTDTVIVKGDYTLAANVENLTINQTVTDSWSATGNGLNNVMLGNGGNNFLDGAAGDDTLNGGAGADNITGGAGNDLLTGGAGKDVFKFASGSGQDRITDFAKADHDAIDVSAYLKAGYKAVLTDVGADVKIAFATGDAIVLTGVHAGDLTATSTGFTI